MIAVSLCGVEQVVSARYVESESLVVVCEIAGVRTCDVDGVCWYGVLLQLRPSFLGYCVFWFVWLQSYVY